MPIRHTQGKTPRLTISTKEQKAVLPITQEVEEALGKLGAENGVCHLSLLHTTAALATADLDPGTDLDYLDALEAMVPQLRYRHPHNPAHFPDHFLSTLMGTSLSLPVEGGKLVLGQWQEVVLIELDGPREREIIVSFLASH